MWNPNNSLKRNLSPKISLFVLPTKISLFGNFSLKLYYTVFKVDCWEIKFHTVLLGV